MRCHLWARILFDCRRKGADCRLLHSVGMFDFDPVTGNQLDSTSRSIMIKSMCMDFDLVDLGKMLLRSKKRKRAKEVGS